MKIYEGLNEKTKDIVIDVLEKYCVPKRVEVIRKETFFGDKKTYNIHLDLEEKPLKFVKEKIEQRINLEKSFNLKIVDPHKNIPQNYTKSKKGLKTEEILEEDNNEQMIPLYTGETTEAFDSLFSLLTHPFKNGEEVKFEDLEEDEKEILLEKAPLEELISENCKIIKSKFGLSVEIKKKL